MKFLCILMALLPTLTFGGQEMKLLTWNVFMIPKPINFSLQRLRSKLIAQKLKNETYDIILMQEAFDRRFRRTVQSALIKDYPHQLHLRKNFKPWTFLSSGLFFASKHPFKVLDHLYFSKCSKGDCLASKGVFLIEITLEGSKKVQIAMTHTQAWDTKKAQKIRAHQFKQIKSLLTAHAKEGIPQILAGDLNIDGKMDHEYPQLLGYMDMEARPLDGGLDYTNGFEIECYKKPGGYPFQWLDHVWINPKGTQAQVSYNSVKEMNGIIKGKECSLSDHHAVEAHIQL